MAEIFKQMTRKPLSEALIAKKLNSGGKLSKQELATFIAQSRRDLKSREQRRKRG